MSHKNNTQDIALSSLKPGMFVVKLDISWLDSPFITNSRLIKSELDIQKLRKAGVKVVTIDTNKGLSPEPPSQAPGATNKSEINKTQTSDQKSSVSSQTKPSARQEMAAAQHLRSKLKSTVIELNSRLERNLPIDSEEIIPLIDSTVESLERNNQALLSLAHLSRKSQKLSDHSFSTFCLALSLERQTPLPDNERNSLGVAALLHESGWLNLPIKLMGKRTPYTAGEHKLIQTHVNNGVKMLSKSQLSELSLRIIGEHHERLDGTGYPNQLNSEKIHKASKILAVADSYDELVHQLRDTPGMLPTNALRMLYVDAEKGHFDSEIVAAFIGVLGVYPVTSAVILNTKERAIIEEVPHNAHLTPIVIVHYDANNNALETPLRIDLREPSADGIERHIESVFDPRTPQNDPSRRMQLDAE